MDSILLCLIIVLESFLSAESFNKPGFKALSKRIDVDRLIKIYDAARVDTWSSSGVIPHPECAIPFRVCDWFCHHSSYYTCKSDRGGDELWCSMVYDHKVLQSKWKLCLMKGPNIADPNKWKAPSSCVRLFATYESKRKNWYYYKGCTTYNSEKPWCSHNYLHKAGKWSYCIDITPNITPNITPKWGEWENWSSFCSKTCDEGRKTRTRKCLKDGSEVSSGCSGSGSESDSCFLINCPVNGGWSPWNQWTNCSANCGNGATIRRRLCDNPYPKYNGAICDGDEMEKNSCTLRECTRKSFVSFTTSNIRLIILYVSLGLVGLASLLALAFFAYNKNLLEKIKQKFGKNGKLSSAPGESTEAKISNIPSLYAEE